MQAMTGLQAAMAMPCRGQLCCVRRESSKPLFQLLRVLTCCALLAVAASAPATAQQRRRGGEKQRGAASGSREWGEDTDRTVWVLQISDLHMSAHGWADR